MAILNRLFYLIGIFLTLLLGNLANAQIELSTTVNAEIHYVNSGKFEKLEAGKAREFNFQEPIWINIKNHVPTMLIPLSSKKSIVKLDTPSIVDAVLRGKQKKIDKELSDILLRFTSVQVMLQRKNIDEAKAQLLELKSKYPDVYFLNFLQASVYMLTGDQNNALIALKKGLLHHPDYEAGKLLLNKLEAKR